jgi:hypothetical protein
MAMVFHFLTILFVLLISCPGGGLEGSKMRGGAVISLIELKYYY